MQESYLKHQSAGWINPGKNRQAHNFVFEIMLKYTNNTVRI